MKYWCFIIWLLLTFLAALSVVGWVLFIPHSVTNPDSNEFIPSSWMKIGKTLVKVINKQEIID